MAIKGRVTLNPTSTLAEDIWLSAMEPDLLTTKYSYPLNPEL